MTDRGRRLDVGNWVAPAVAEYLPKTIWWARNREPTLASRHLSSGVLLEPSAVTDTLLLSARFADVLLSRAGASGIGDLSIVEESVRVSSGLPVQVGPDDVLDMLAQLRGVTAPTLTSPLDFSQSMLCCAIAVSAAAASLLHMSQSQLDRLFVDAMFDHRDTGLSVNPWPSTAGMASRPWTSLGPRSGLVAGSLPPAPTDAPTGDYLWADLLRLALHDGGGVLRHRSILARAARGALLIDMVALGVISRDETGLTYDLERRDVPLAGAVLDDLSAHPDRTLSEVIQRGHPHLDDFTDALLAAGVWTRGPAPRSLGRVTCRIAMR